MQIPHFEEEGRVNPTSKGDRMPAAAYSLALDHLVLTCVDLALIYQGQILLGRRHQYPRKSWWLIGGRMMVGEDPLVAVQRKASEEAGLILECDRFHYVGVYSTCFAMREQEPQRHGSHTVNLTYQAILNPDEKAAVKLSNQEYEAGFQWVDLNQVGEVLELGDRLDQALLHIMQDIQQPPYLKG
jgi:ADP-ribose pyrophosphatase YjhB (NUDIX family)